MLDKRLEKIRHDLDLFLPSGSYRLERPMEGRLKLIWAEDLPGDLKHFSAEVLRLYGVPFEAESRSGPLRVARS